MTISLGGTATVPHLDFTVSGLVRSADDLLFRAKKEGRNRALVEAYIAGQPQT